MSEPANAGQADLSASPGLQAVEVLARYLEGAGWAPERLPGRNSFAVSFAGAHGALRCLAQVRADAEQLICYVFAPIAIPEGRRPAVAEFITRANYGIYIGNFELDYADGEVRCRCSLDFEGECLTANLVRNTLVPAVRLMETYLPGLIAVAQGAAPRAAVETIEQKPL